MNSDAKIDLAATAVMEYVGTTPHNSIINLLPDIYSVCMFVCCLCVSFNSCSSSCMYHFYVV